jgi:trehalose 6-phosphate synthase/phosphatase
LLFQDEDVYTFFEPELPSDAVGIARSKATDGLKLPVERRSSLKLPPSRSGSKSSQTRTPRPSPNPDKKPVNPTCGSSRRPSPEKISWNVLDLKGENYFSCSVGRTRTNARYILQSSDDVVSFLKELASSGSSSS